MTDDVPGGLESALERTRATLDGTNDRLDRLDRQAIRQRWAVAGLFLAAVIGAFALISLRSVTDEQRADDRRDEQRAVEADRQRCEDAIEGRADLREAVSGVVEIVIGITDDPAALAPLLDDVRSYLAGRYGPPACAERLDIEIPPSPPATPVTLTED